MKEVWGWRHVGVQGFQAHNAKVGRKKKILAGGFRVPRVTSLADPPRKEEKSAIVWGGGVKPRVGGMIN